MVLSPAYQGQRLVLARRNGECDFRISQISVIGASLNAAVQLKRNSFNRRH